ncbi:MAG: radical SAM family heme chaperone HemW [Alphaproteobacteria bacterium]|nr:radical SAM family heme chaperone HemW [Alphaproteobacteria bacterium]
MNCPHNLYIHVPFCMSKCQYCAFFSVACNNPDWKKYADNICSELKFWSDKLGKIKIPTIFFGGGTPSLMPVETLEQILKCIYDNFDVDKDCEITLESNPKTLDKTKLSEFVSLGMNRLSVGVQSLNDEELKFLGRIHNVKDAIDLIQNAQNMNLRVSADFIYGLPNQDENSVINLCQNINKIGLEHVSMYELTIEKNTPFRRQNLKMPNNETMAKMYNAIPEYLNLPRYEVSNYAKPGQECRHNQNIWHGGAYIGIGRGGAGRVFMNDKWYEQMGNNEKFDEISNEIRAVEKIITGLRTILGVRLDEDIKNQINFDWVKNHSDLVVVSDEYLKTTKKGMLFLDDIMVDVIK